MMDLPKTENGVLDPKTVLDFLKTGSKVPGDCGNPPDKRPEWLDMEKCRRARKLYDEYYYSVMACHNVGVYLMAHVPSLATPLIFTGKSESIAKSCRRWADTIHHVYSWYDGDIWDTKDYAHKSVMLIRGRHERVSKNMNPDDTADSPKDKIIPPPQEDGDVWLSQYDMAITLFTFLAAIIVNPDKVGMSTASDEDIDCLIHLWRGIGYLLGIEDRYNIFGFGGIRQLQPLFVHIIHEVALFHWDRPQEEFTKLLTVASDSLRYITIFASKEASINFAFYVADQPEKIPLDWYGYYCRQARAAMLYLMKYQTSRRYLNGVMRPKLNRIVNRYKTGGHEWVCPGLTKTEDEDNIIWGLYQRIKKILS